MCLPCWTASNVQAGEAAQFSFAISAPHRGLSAPPVLFLPPWCHRSLCCLQKTRCSYVCCQHSMKLVHHPQTSSLWMSLTKPEPVTCNHMLLEHDLHECWKETGNSRSISLNDWSWENEELAILIYLYLWIKGCILSLSHRKHPSVHI